MYDVAIIGGGVVGCAIARELSRYRLRVVLLEAAAEVGFGVSKSNSGIIHAGHQSDPATVKGSLDVRGNALFGPLAEELGFAFRRIGALVVARSRDELPALKALQAQGAAKGVPGLELWSAGRLQREEPNLAPSLAGALYAPSAGVINPYEACFALAENAVANGVELHTESPVQRIDRADGHLVLHTPGGRWPARFVLNCAGLYADRVAALVGLHDYTIQPRRGEEYLLDKRLEGLVRRIVYPLPGAHTKGILIIPTYDGTIMVGPTAEEQDAREDVHTTDAGAQQVFAAVAALCPAIGPQDTIAEFAGLRPVSSTNDFIIGPTAVPGFIDVAGIQSPGLTAAPAIAERVVAILAEQGLALAPAPAFQPRLRPPVRFGVLPFAEQQRLALEDPRYARIVCRCELVTEAEVLAAIDRGARTLDGVKFRVRAGMGRCQGGFCTTRCMELLARRQDVPLTAITKRGGGSWLVTELGGPQHPAERERVQPHAMPERTAPPTAPEARES
jgi:glycerol-3-phosphate dehydrogenase